MVGGVWLTYPRCVCDSGMPAGRGTGGFLLIVWTWGQSHGGLGHTEGPTTHQAHVLVGTAGLRLGKNSSAESKHVDTVIVGITQILLYLDEPQPITCIFHEDRCSLILAALALRLLPVLVDLCITAGVFKQVHRTAW